MGWWDWTFTGTGQDQDQAGAQAGLMLVVQPRRSCAGRQSLVPSQVLQRATADFLPSHRGRKKLKAA